MFKCEQTQITKQSFHLTIRLIFQYIQTELQLKTRYTQCTVGYCEKSLYSLTTGTCSIIIKLIGYW